MLAIRAAKLADKPRRLGLDDALSGFVTSVADDTSIDDRLVALLVAATELDDPESALRELLGGLVDGLRRAELEAPEREPGR